MDYYSLLEISVLLKHTSTKYVLYVVGDSFLYYFDVCMNIYSNFKKNVIRRKSQII